MTELMAVWNSKISPHVSQYLYCLRAGKSAGNHALATASRLTLRYILMETEPLSGE